MSSELATELASQSEAEPVANEPIANEPKVDKNTLTQLASDGLGELDEAEIVEAPQSPQSRETNMNGINSRDSTEESEEALAVIKPSIALRDDPHYRINPDRYNGWFRGYVRQDWGTVNIKDGGELEELRAGWIELFFDLIFVAGIVHISSESVYALDQTSGSHRRRLAGGDCALPDDDFDCETKNLEFLFCTFVQFGLLQLLWLEQVSFESRFANEQMMDAFLRFLTMAAILSMGSTVSDEEQYFQAFLFSYAMAKFFMLLSYSKTSLIPRARNHCLLQVFLTGSLIILSIIFCLTIDGDAFDWLIVYSIIWVLHYVSSWQVWKWPNYHVSIPINVPHMAERLGLFTMLILGESIISLMTANIPLSIDFMLLIMAGFIIAYALGLLYFSCQPTEEKILSGINTHAMRSEKWRARLFNIAHTILYLSLLGLGVGMKVDTFHINNDQPPHHGRQPIDTMLPGYSVFLACVALNMIRISHPFEHRSKWVWTVRIGCLVALAIIPAFWTVSNALVLGLILVFVLIQVLVDEEGREVKKEQKTETKERVKEAVERQQTQTGNFGSSIRSTSSSSALVKSQASLKDRSGNKNSNDESTSNTNNNHMKIAVTSADDINVQTREEEIAAGKRRASRQHRAQTSGQLRGRQMYLKKQVSGVGFM